MGQKSFKVSIISSSVKIPSVTIEKTIQLYLLFFHEIFSSLVPVASISGCIGAVSKLWPSNLGLGQYDTIDS